MKMARMSCKAVYFLSVILIVLVMVTFLSRSSAFAQQQFTFGSSGIGGVSFVVGAGLTNIWNQDLKGKVIWTCETSGGSTQNIAWLGTGMLQAGLVSTDRTWGAKLGIGQFQKSGPLKVENVRSFAVLYGNWLQPVVRADFKGEDVLDLFGKRVAVGQPGHASQAMLIAIAQTGGYGEDLSKKMQYEYVADYEAVDALKSGRVDGVFFGIGLGAGTITEAFQTQNLKFLTMKESFMKDIIKKYPYYSIGKIPPGTYPKQTKEVPVFGSTMTLVVTTAIPDDIAYEMMKSFDRELKNGNLLTVAQNFGEVKLNGDIQNITGYPIHPGAKKYYEEQGIKIQPMR